jgi:hypothetical protein
MVCFYNACHEAYMIRMSLDIYGDNVNSSNLVLIQWLPLCLIGLTADFRLEHLDTILLKLSV